MKCPNCGVDVNNYKQDNTGLMLLNMWYGAMFSFAITYILNLFLKIDIKHGYPVNYDVLILLGLIFTYSVYVVLYNYDKVQGTFILMKKGVNYK